MQKRSKEEEIKKMHVEKWRDAQLLNGISFQGHDSYSAGSDECCNLYHLPWLLPLLVCACVHSCSICVYVRVGGLEWPQTVMIINMIINNINVRYVYPGEMMY